MNDDNNNPTASSLNNIADERIRTSRPPEEKYTKGDEGAKIANVHQPLSDTEAVTNRSWALSEIERTISSEVLPVGRQKISQFGMNLTRKQDFRLRDLTRKLDRQVRTEFSGTGAGAARGPRPSDFQVRSHSLAMIRTNAALGSYQFQKNAVLPYMRKSLALDFQRTNLLKRVVGSIGGLEKAVIAKLEAIKMNTAAAAPNKISMFTRLRNAVRDKQVDRVAGNISNLIMDRHAETWRKNVAPVLAKLDKIMQTDGPRGGVNGVTRGLSRKFNRLRHSWSKTAGQVGENGLRSKPTGFVSNALGSAARFAQRSRLSTGLNTLVSKPLSNGTAFINKLNPFQGTTIEKHDLEELGDDITENQGRGINSPQYAALVTLLTGWRREAKSSHARLIEEVIGVREEIGALKKYDDSKQSPRLRTSLSQRGSANKILANTKLFNVPRNNGVRLNTKLGTIATAAASPYAVALRWKKFTADSVGVDFQTGQAVQTSMIGAMTQQLANINTSIQQGNGARTLYERFQTKRQAIADKLAVRMRLRKGSYEDLHAMRGNKSGVLGGDQLRDTAAAVAAAAKSGLGGAAGEKEGGFDWSSLTDLFGGSDGKGSRLGRRAKISMRRGSRGLKGLFGRGARGSARGFKGLAQLGLKGMWSGTKATGRLGTKGLFSVIKGGGTGAFKLAKSGLGIGALLGVGRHYLGKSDLDKDVKGDADTLMAMGEYGSMGSMFGPYGAMVGAALGGIVANTDYASKRLAQLGDVTAAVGSGIWTTIFGQKAKVRSDGTVVQQEKSSLLGDMKIALFGRKARYSSSGEVIAPERSNILGAIQYGFEKTFFGDRYSNNDFKQGTSLLEMARDGLKEAISGFGKQLSDLPSDLKKGFKNGSLAKGAIAAKDYTGRKADQFKAWSGRAEQSLMKFSSDTANNTSSFMKNLTWQKAGNLAIESGKNSLGFAAWLSPTNFAMGASKAIYGWWIDSGEYNDPATPQYKFVELTLGAYGIKNRALYKFVHSLETSQEKVNNGQLKPFDDKDMAFMAGRFGFDSKNKDAVEYFKLWYKRRFIAAMTVVDKVLKSRRLSFGSVMAAEPKELDHVNELLKKAIAGSGVLQLGMEPSAQAYNRYVKSGTGDPGGISRANLAKDKAFDPRDPSNHGGSSFDISSDGLTRGTLSNRNYVDGSDWRDSAVAGRKRAAMVKGGVRDQPEYKAAYQKLPQNIKKVVDKSRPLQFVLWSTAIQHGPQLAALIFERDYSVELDEKGYLRSIYQDRSRQFGALNANDRGNAIGRLGEEQRFALGLNNNSYLGRGQMQSMVGDVVDPNGNYGGFTGEAPKGSVGERARMALQYLMQKGYTKSAAAGIVGNLVEESQLRTNAVGDSGKAHGIAQWHPDRRQKIANRFRKSIESMSFREQLDAVDWELRSGSGVTGGKDLAGDLNKASSAGAAAIMVMNRYERPLERSNNGRKRAGVAMSLMNSTGGNSPEAPSTPKASSGGSSTSGQQAAPAKAPAPAAPRTARKSAPAPAAPAAPAHDMSAWASALDRHTDAMKALTTVNGGQGPMKPNQNNTIIAPTVHQHGGGRAAPFLAMSMKKSMLVTGNSR